MAGKGFLSTGKGAQGPAPAPLVPGSAGWLPSTGAPLMSSVNPSQRDAVMAQMMFANANRAPGSGVTSMEQDRQAFVASNRVAAEAKAAAEAEAARRAAAQAQQTGNPHGTSGDNYGDNYGGQFSDGNRDGGFGGYGGVY